MKEGVLVGANMLDFIPWNQSALEHMTLLKPWLLSWMGLEVEILTPEGWFLRGHNQLDGSFDKNKFWQHNIVPGKLFLGSPAGSS
jgi:hypothetical protein